MTNWNELDIDEPLMARIKAEFDKSGSDKTCHNYERVYQHFFSKIPVVNAILEIGLSNYPPPGGSSLFAWPRLYPNSLIRGGDLQFDRMLECPDPTHLSLNVPIDIDMSKIKTSLVDQASLSSLKTFAEALGNTKFEIIVDDASHAFDNSRRTFDVLFDKLADPGYYFVEDVARPNRNDWQQTAKDWIDFLKDPALDYKIVDARPEAADDNDSIMICIWRKT